MRKRTGESRSAKRKSKQNKPKKKSAPAKTKATAKRRKPKARSESTKSTRTRTTKSTKKAPKSAPDSSRTDRKEHGGRPTLYTPEIGQLICARVMAGEPLRQILLLPGMPESRNTVFAWLASNKEFQDNYARAKEIQMEAFAEELLDIADDSRNDWLERENERTGEVKTVLNEEAIARARLRIETRKWKMSKFAPKKFGERLAVDHAGAVSRPIMTLAEFEKRFAKATA